MDRSLVESGGTWLAFRVVISLVLLLGVASTSASGSDGYVESKLLAFEGSSNDYFGYRVAMDGDRAVVGAYGDGPGSAFVYHFEPASNLWLEEAWLRSSDGSSGDRFGISQRIDGDVIVVGAYHDNDNGYDSGSAYVFRFDPGTGTWIEEAKLLPSDGASGDKFGTDCAISGDAIVVGARYDDDNGTDSGSAYVFRYDPNAQTWTEETKLLASDGSADDSMGMLVSIDGDVIAVSSHWDDDNGGSSGSAYIFRYDPDLETWSEDAKLTASDGASGHIFSHGLSVHADRILVGAPGRGSSAGAVYHFEYDPGSGLWNEKSSFQSSGGKHSQFGCSIDLDGDKAVIGARADDENGSDSGAAYVFAYDPGSSTWIEETKLMAGDGAGSDQFGGGVARSGEFVLVGSRYDDDWGSRSGSAYAYRSGVIVPDDHPTIQGAIDSVSDGAIVLVRPGTYAENIDFVGKAITVKGQKGSGLTTIDGNQSGSVVTFQNGEGSGSVLLGFTITNGLATAGGGIYCNGSSPMFSINKILDNAAGSGGGICCENSASPVIVNTIIRGNTASNDGGGIHCSASSPTVTNATIFENTAAGCGGGLCCIDSSPVITNTILWGDAAATDPEVHADGGSSPVVTYSDVQGGWSGTGNIDDDPEFLDESAGDLHLTLLSSCRNTGDDLAAALPARDMEYDPRIVHNAVDMGVDEFNTHLYYRGAPVPGGTIDIVVVGASAEPVEFALGSSKLKAPLLTAHGKLFIRPIVWRTSLGTTPPDGALVWSGTLPAHWIPGDLIPFQALVGAWGDAGTELTNLLVLEVE